MPGWRLMGIFAVVQKDPCPVFVPDAYVDVERLKINSLVRMTNWYWPTMATVGISISREPKCPTLASASVSRRDTNLTSSSTEGNSWRPAKAGNRVGYPGCSKLSKTPA